MQPPEDFILLILLCSWLPMSQPDAPWDVLDYFCGVGRISQLASKVGFQSAARDIKHHQPDARSESQRKSGRHKRSRFDINGEVGFALPCSIGKFCFLEWENFYQGSAPPQINSITLLDMFLCETIPADAPAACWKLRLMVSLALQGKFAQLLMMLATVCSTWVAVNVGTSRRSVLTPSGLWHYTSVRKANKQVTRSGLRNKFCKC